MFKIHSEYLPTRRPAKSNRIGFSIVIIRKIRRFYEMYPIWSAVSTELSWAHFQELIKIDRKEEI